MSQPISLSSDTQVSSAAESRDSGSVNTLINGILIVFLIASVSENLVLYRQAKDLGESLKAKQAQVAQAEEVFAQGYKPRIDSIVGNLSIFAKTSPDFAPILEKYKGALPAPGPAAAPKR